MPKREIIPTSNHLFTVKQQQFESICAYKDCFNKEAVKVPDLSDCEHIQAYKHSIQSLSLTKELATKNLLIVDNLLDTVLELIKGEISVQSKREQHDNIFMQGK